MDKCECEIPDTERKLRMQSQCTLCTIEMTPEERKRRRTERIEDNFKLFGRRPGKTEEARREKTEEEKRENKE